MGLVTVNLTRVLEIFRQYGVKNKSICMMGRQTLEIEIDTILIILEKYDFECNKEDLQKIFNNKEIDTYDFFRLLGFSEVYAVDKFQEDNPNILFDLNEEMLPYELFQKFDYVLDGGTLEHIFNVSQAIKNMANMVKIGGYIIHISPAGGYVDHGFYSFSPTMYQDFYTGNKFNIKKIDLGFYFDKKQGKDWKVTYSQDCRLYHNWIELNEYIQVINKLDSVGRIMIWCIAQRLENNKCEIYPVQTAYCQKKPKYIIEVNKKPKTFDMQKVIKFIEANSNMKISLYGTGYVCNLVINEIYYSNMEKSIFSLFDSNINKAGDMLRGYNIAYPTERKLEEVDIVLICSNLYDDEIFDEICSKYPKIVTKVLKITDFA